jgi:hypothetical protein
MNPSLEIYEWIDHRESHSLDPHRRTVTLHLIDGDAQIPHVVDVKRWDTRDGYMLAISADPPELRASTDF